MNNQKLNLVYKYSSSYFQLRELSASKMYTYLDLDHWDLDNCY